MLPPGLLSGELSRLSFETLPPGLLPGVLLSGRPVYILPDGLLAGEPAGPLVKMLPLGLSRGVLSGRFVNTLPAGPFPRALSGRLEKMLPDGRLDGEGPGRGLSIRADGLPGEAVRDISRDGAGERPPRISGALRLSRALGAEPRSGPRSREPCGDAQQAELNTSTGMAAATTAASAANPERSVRTMVTPPSAKRECRTH